MTNTHEHIDNIRDAIACNLTVSEAEPKALEWVGLLEKLVSSRRIENGVSMSFEPSLAPEIEDLAERERACCGFMSITTTLSSEEMRIDVTTENATALPMIESMAGLTP